MRTGTYLANGLASLAVGLGCRTALFVCLLKPSFHSYDCAKDEYQIYFQFGSHVAKYNDVVLSVYVIPLLFFIAGLILAWRAPQPKRFSKLAWAGIIMFGVGAELAFWLVQFWLAFAAHFTTGDVFTPGAC